MQNSVRSSATSMASSAVSKIIPLPKNTAKPVNLSKSATNTNSAAKSNSYNVKKSIKSC